MSRHEVYRDGRVHVMSEMCSTCVFRPGNLMRLAAGRLRGMIDEATAEDAGTVVCHQTLGGYGVRNAACRGFFDRYPTLPLRMAAYLDRIEFVDPPLDVPEETR
jgi:hypothetical protein